MGLSSKKTTTKSSETSTSAPSTFSQPYIQDAVDQTRPGFDAAQGLVRQYTPTLQRGVDYYGDVLVGKYLDKNPYLESIVKRGESDAADAVASRYSAAGRYGSGYGQGAIAREVADAGNRLRYQDYSTERGYQQQAPGQQASLISNLVGMQQEPGGKYANIINSLVGRYGTQTGSGTNVTKQSGSIIDAIAKIAQIASVAVPSDPRLKMDVNRVGELEDGLGIYDFRYVTDDPDTPLRRGVMADEVEKLRPWALGPERNGFKTVMMGKL
jgi:hypothetical protein